MLNKYCCHIVIAITARGPEEWRSCTEEASDPQSLWGTEKVTEAQWGHVSKDLQKGWGRVWWLREGRFRRGRLATGILSLSWGRDNGFTWHKSWDWTLGKPCEMLSPGEGLPECDSWKACREVGHGQSAFLTGSSNPSSRRPLMSCNRNTCSPSLAEWPPNGFTFCLGPCFSHLDNLLVEVDSLWGQTFWNFLFPRAFTRSFSRRTSKTCGPWSWWAWELRWYGWGKKNFVNWSTAR